MRTSPYKDESGFALIQVLTVMAILGIVASSVAGLSQYITLMSAGADLATDMKNSMTELTMALSDPTTCALNLKGKNLNGQAITLSSFNFPAKNSTGTLSSNPILSESPRVKVKSMKIISDPSTNRSMNLHLEFESKIQTLGPSAHFRVLPLQVILSSTGEITSCAAMPPGGKITNDCNESPWGSSVPTGAPSVVLPAAAGKVVDYKDTRYICLAGSWSNFSYVITENKIVTTTVISGSGSSHYGGHD